ncbi:stalk domain-containing protein [Brevibacillus sp. H7]|uniref:stalk domain-containing protein n=1 Tax=Brevibacillus sp. H7 TaxID=3349138 RepID=UPI0037F167D1
MKWDLKSFAGGIVAGSVLFSGLALAAPGDGLTELNKTPFTYYFEGVPKSPTTEVQGILHKNSVYVPIRFVAESLGKTVIYDAKSKSIYIGKLPANKMYSKWEAVELVKKKYGQKVTPDYRIEYDHDDENGNYVIHIYQKVVNNFQTGDSYTNTYGWFVVNPNTGEIKSLL